MGDTITRYCSAAASCPFYQHWRASKSRNPLQVIRSDTLEIPVQGIKRIVYSCNAFEYCTGPQPNAEDFLQSLPEALRGNKADIKEPPIRRELPDGCSVIQTLNMLSEIRGASA
jgi:hypothetical protein